MLVNADEIRPALLDIKEQNTGLFAVTWKVPSAQYHAGTGDPGYGACPGGTHRGHYRVEYPVPGDGNRAQAQRSVRYWQCGGVLDG